MEETEIIVEQPLAPQGRSPSRFTPEPCHSSPLPDEEQEDDTAIEGGWVTVDEDELPARGGRGPSRRSADGHQIPDVPSLTLSTSTTSSSLPTLSPTRLEPREGAGVAVAGRRNLSSDSGRYGDVIHEGDEDGPRTPIDGEEELLKPLPPTASLPERVLLTKNNGDLKRGSSLDSFGLGVANAPTRT